MRPPQSEHFVQAPFSQPRVSCAVGPRQQKRASKPMRGTHKAFICFLLPILLLAAGAIDPALAQQQEKRIALVVGNGAYAKSPLATPANDAGLIAQTLQAAGFDVVGARDLDGDTLRKSFR